MCMLSSAAADAAKAKKAGVDDQRELTRGGDIQELAAVWLSVAGGGADALATSRMC